MDNIILKSKDLKEYVYDYLKKSKDALIYEKDLEDVTSLSLMGQKFDGTINEFEWGELAYFKNVESCTLSKFIINDDMISAFKSLEKLQIILFTHCKFEADMGFENDLKVIYFTCSDLKYFENFRMCQNIEKIQIVGCDKVDITDLLKFKNIRELYIYNSKIDNSLEIKNLEKLESLNLKGSQLDSENLENILRKDIEFAYSPKKYRPMDRIEIYNR